MKAKIYKITNLINNKIYVGKTTTSLAERFNTHIKDSRRREKENRPLYKAFNKYGIENFKIELIEECDYSILDEREKYWIKFYDSYSNGYNATLGGDGKILYDYNLIEQLLLSGYTPKEITNQIGCCVDVVHKVAHECNISIQKDNKLKQEMKNNAIPVNQYELDGTYIQTFNSYAEAARWLFQNQKIKKVNGGVRTHIADVCNGKRKTAYKYIWKNADSDKGE